MENYTYDDTWGIALLKGEEEGKEVLTFLCFLYTAALFEILQVKHVTVFKR